MYILRNSCHVIRIKTSFNLLYAPSRKLNLSSKNFSKKEDIMESANSYGFTLNTNKFNLPVPIKPTIFQKLKEQFGFQGTLRHPQPALAMASFRIYLSIQYQIDYDRFFKLCESPDVMYSFCLVTFLHVWLASIPLFQHGQTGLFVRRELYRNMWTDIETRARKLNAPMNRKNKLVTFTHMNEIFRAFLFGFDEGILSDDTVLAGAIWRHLLEMKELNDFAVLGILCDYIRKNVAHLDKINELDLLKNGIVTFVDFDQQEVDHLVARTKIIAKINAKQNS